MVLLAVGDYYWLSLLFVGDMIGITVTVIRSVWPRETAALLSY